MASEITYTARTDSNSANNPALNLTGDPALSITFVSETITGADGDLFLEGDTDAGTADPDTIVRIGGVDYEFSITLTGTLPTSNSDGARQVPVEFRGSDVYLVTVYDYPSPGDTTRLAFLPNEDATLADMDAFGNGRISVQNLNNNPPPSPICFTEGTLIATPDGPVPVERLRPGDLVTTADHGAQPVIWPMANHYSWDAQENMQKPVQLKRGSLGPNTPARDLCVSPQHRMVLICPDSGCEVMAPAIALTRFRGIRQMNGKREVTYYHIALAHHGIVFAENAASESLLPGPMARASLGALGLKNIQDAFRAQGIELSETSPTARPFLRPKDVRSWAAVRAPEPRLEKVAP